MDSNVNLADFKTVMGDGMNGWGGNNIVWLFLLFALFGGNFGGLGGRGQAATTDELSAGFANSAVLNKLNELAAGQANINQNLGNAICQLGYQGAQHTYELGSKIDNCCCNTQLGIQGVKFDMANYASAIQMNDTANTQKVLDKLCEIQMSQKDATIAQQGQRIAALETNAAINAATCNIPRINTDGWGVFAYPTCAPYAAGNNCCCPSI